MTCSSDQAYRFSTPAQWQSGAHDLEVSDGGLESPPFRCLEPIGELRGGGAGSGPDGLSLPAIDSCGRLNWLSSTDRTWDRRYPFGIERIGRLTGGADPETVRDMVLGCGTIWLQTASGLERYAAYDLRFLGPVDPPHGDTILAIASDHDDGLYVLSSNGDRMLLTQLDRWGRSCKDPVTVPGPVPESAALAATPDGLAVFVLLGTGLSTHDPLPDNVPPSLPALHIVREGSDDSGYTDGECTVARLPVVFSGRVPLSLAPSDPDRVVLLSRSADADSPTVPDPSITLETFDSTGGLTRQEAFEIPPGLGDVLSIAGGSALTIRGTGGLVSVVDCERDQPANHTFITPTLIAPLDGKGWNRAELSVLIPDGASVEIDWFSTSDQATRDDIHAVFVAGPSSPRSRLAALEAQLIPWRPSADADGAKDRCAEDSQEPADEPKLRPILLDQATGQYLWVRIRMTAPVGQPTPKPLSFDVLYGNDSYIDELPSIYQEHPRSEYQLRQILAPFEVVFDQLDAEIAALPGRIDPATAPDEWTDYLLSWLGLPRLGDLEPTKRRRLLEAAPELLAARGTAGALESALDVVTGGRATVLDSGDQLAAWFLPRSTEDEASSGGVASARLGTETLVRGQQPPPFRSGSVVLGATPLGKGCVDPALVLAEGSGKVTIIVDMKAEDGAALAPIIDRLLAVFVPAHCRVEVIYSETDPATTAPRLDDNFRLADDDPDSPGTEGPSTARLYSDGHWRLGSTNRLGAWQLPNPLRPSLVLDRQTAPDRNRYLN